MRGRRFLATAVVISGCLAAGSAYAQSSDADWLANCKNQRDSRVRHCEVRPVNVAWSGVVRVDASPNGGVQLTGGDVAAVTGSARIEVQAASEAEARTIAGSISIDDSTGALKAKGPERRSNESWSVSFVLTAPRQTDVQANTVNGPMSVAGMSGRIHATTVNGPLSVKDVAGDVQVRTTNGPLSVTLGGTSWVGAGLDASTQNGPLRISIPDGYSAQLISGTTNGPMNVRVPIPMQTDEWGRRSRSINTAIGGGGAPVRAVTTNGPLTIDRR